MRNVFLFIRRYSNFLFFLLLQIIALSFLFRYNRFHEAAFMNLAGEITGKFDERYNTVEYYFHLKKTNQDLAAENEHLRQVLKENFEGIDSSRKIQADTVLSDSLRLIQKYFYRLAKVVGNTTDLQTNYMTIHRGAGQGIRPNMGVVSPQGIVGRVVNVSANYASVMSLLNRNFKVVVKLKRGGERGTVEWDGTSPLYVTLKDIPKSAHVAVGDSVVSSPITRLFPGNLMVGTIKEILDDKSTNFYTLKLQPSTNFFNVEYVYVIENFQDEEQRRLEDSTRKKFQ